MKKTIIGLILAIALYPNLMYAMLTVDKYYLLLDDKRRNISLTVYNTDNKDRDYKVSIINYKQLPSGDYELINEEGTDIKFASNYIIYTPMKFSIAKKKSQIIRVQKRPMPNAANGEYLSYILITELADETASETSNTNVQNNQIALNITPIFSIALPIVVRKGELTSSANIGKITVKKQKDRDVSVFTIPINREGNKSLRGNLLIKYKNKVLQNISGINVFLTTKTRNISFEVESKYLKKYKKGDKFIAEFVDFYNNNVLSAKEFEI